MSKHTSDYLLIVAALLAALRAMERCPGYWTTDQETGQTFADIARAAIAKGEGA
jgi:hypothetical protein